MQLLLKLGTEKNLECADQYSSPLERWCIHNGTESLVRFLSSDPLKVTFDCGEPFDPIDAHIDPEQELPTADRLSQVRPLSFAISS